jgi:hypothetical protein
LAWTTHAGLEDVLKSNWDKSTFLPHMLQPWQKKSYVCGITRFLIISFKGREGSSSYWGDSKRTDDKLEYIFIAILGEASRGIKRILRQEELRWYQKSRINWISFGKLKKIMLPR